MNIAALPFAALDPATAYAVWRLRQEVFVVEQECPYPDLDGRDPEPGTRHVLLRDGSGEDGGGTDRYAGARGYYIRLSRRAAEGAASGTCPPWRFDEAELPEPDVRVGFPFTQLASNKAARARASRVMTAAEYPVCY